MSTIALRPGPLSAGIDKPWIAPESLITSKLEAIGFRNIVWHDGQAGAPSQRTVLNSGDWDHWISADYQGPAQSFTVPVQLKWWAPKPGYPHNSQSSEGTSRVPAPPPVAPPVAPPPVAPPVGPPVGPLESYAKKLGLEPGQAIGMLCLELAAEIALFNAIRGWFKRRRG